MIDRIQNELFQWWERTLEISPSIFLGLILLLFFSLLGTLVKRLFLNRFSKRFSDQLLARFLGNLIFWIFICIGLIFFLNEIGLGKAAAGLLAGAGVTAIILGFAFKDIGENLLSGIMLAFSRPFNIGDVIEIDSYTGTVESLNLRNTHIRTFNGRDIFIPNSNMVKDVVVNYTRDGLLRHDFIVGIAYEESISEVIKIIEESLSEIDEIIQKGELNPFISIQDFGASTLNLKVHFWINSLDYVGSTLLLKTKVMKLVMEALITAGINTPAEIIEHKMYKTTGAIPLELKPSKS